MEPDNHWVVEENSLQTWHKFEEFVLDHFTDAHAQDKNSQARKNDQENGGNLADSPW